MSKCQTHFEVLVQEPEKQSKDGKYHNRTHCKFNPFKISCHFFLHHRTEDNQETVEENGTLGSLKQNLVFIYFSLYRRLPPLSLSFYISELAFTFEN